MKNGFDLIRQFSASLMLVAVMALTLQAGIASASALGSLGDCLNEIQVIPSADRGNHVISIEQSDVDEAHQNNTPCKSACCSIACSMAVLRDQVTLPVPTLVTTALNLFVFQGAEGIDLKGLSRPPKARLFV
jgi:hypothetical protein